MVLSSGRAGGGAHLWAVVCSPSGSLRDDAARDAAGAGVSTGGVFTRPRDVRGARGVVALPDACTVLSAAGETTYSPARRGVVARDSVRGPARYRIPASEMIRSVWERFASPGQRSVTGSRSLIPGPLLSSALLVAITNES
jgi:hypothetical protein